MNVSASVTAVSERMDAAEAELRRERRRTADELEALKAFEDRIRSIEPTTPPRTRNDRVIVPGLSPPAVGLDRVRNVYEATVMSVPHYVEEYDDTYRESLEEEFAPDLAFALTDGSRFDDRCKRAVLSSIDESKTARESLLQEVDAERESIEDAAAALSPIAEELDELATVQFRDRSFGALDAYRSRLNVLERNCEAISDRRQETVFEQRRTRWLPNEISDIARYFYQRASFNYPVMSAVALLVEAICERRSRIERAMTYCHT